MLLISARDAILAEPQSSIYICYTNSEDSEKLPEIKNDLTYDGSVNHL